MRNEIVAGGMDKLVCPCVTTQLWAISCVEALNPTKGFGLWVFNFQLFRLVRITEITS